MLIEKLSPESPDARALLAQSDEYMAALYPAESNHMDGTQELKKPNVHFVGAFIDGLLVGCGAVKLLDGDVRYGEIKRIFVIDAYRGRGVARKIMEELESHLVERGTCIARLETGVSQPEAIGLYTKLGYVARRPFGKYEPDSLSIFMEKQIEARNSP